MVSSSATQAAPTQPFDAVAAEYDAEFTQRRLGRWLRGMVWKRLGAAFQPGQHVLELGCGTGQDAVWLARRGVRVTATDASAAMLDITRRKADAAGVADLVNVAQLDLASLAVGAPEEPARLTSAATLRRKSQRLIPTGLHGFRSDEAPATCWVRPAADWSVRSKVGLEDQYDGAYSNFGPLNCVEDRAAVAAELARVVRQRGRVVVVVMGPVCPWEIIWHCARGRFKTAFRRFRHGADAHVGDGQTLRVWYPSPRRLEREFMPYFKSLEVAGIGLLLPPSEMGRLVDRAPGLFGRLAWLDQRFATALPWRYLNDHYLMMLERR